MILFAGRANQVYLQDRMRRGDLLYESAVPPAILSAVGSQISQGGASCLIIR